MPTMKSSIGLGVALSLGLLLGVSAAEARGGFGGGGFAMNGRPGFQRFGMAVPGRQFAPMGWRHANFHDFHHGRFDHFHRHFFGFPFFVSAGSPYDYGYYDYGYGGGCGWAYRNARATGSPYWWNRYYACISYGY